MAITTDLSSWVPEPIDGPVMQRVRQVSAVEDLAPPLSMSSRTQKVPRASSVDVDLIGIGGTYAEDTGADDTVTLTAWKFGKIVKFEEEDLADAASTANAITVKQTGWASSWAKLLDNACLATSGSASTTPGDGLPFDSVYQQVRFSTDDGYTADANRTAGAVTYANLSTTVGLVEDSDYYDEGRMVWIASRAARADFRGVADTTGRPLFVEGVNGLPDTLMGAPIRYTQGARLPTGNGLTAEGAVVNPAGERLIIYCNRDFLRLGRRSGPESQISAEPNFYSDEPALKMRARRGFAVGTPHAFAILQTT